MSALECLTPAERGALLDALITERPELRDQAERHADAYLRAVDTAEVADEVVRALNAVPLDAIAQRVGRRTGGFVHPEEAASELLGEALEPFCDDISRRGKAGLADAAVALGLAVLDGLYRLRTHNSGTTVLGALEAETETWELATSVVIAWDEGGVTPPRDVVDSRFPKWAGIA